MKALVNMRAAIDKLNKAPSIARTGDRRSLGEKVNTNAIAKGHAIDQIKHAKVMETKSLADLIRQSRKSY
jgi:hypothetical protein